MAGRQFKEGIDFFYFDTDFFTNDKMQLIEAEFGIKGTIVALRLLCKIYRDKGYYYQWGGDECLLFSRAAGAEFVPNAVNEIVNGLVRRRFFDKGCFDRFGILTSQSIQNAYIQATERRKSVDLIQEYLLLDLEQKPINVNIISINVSINNPNVDKSTQSKVKYSKVKKKKNIAKIDGNDVASHTESDPQKLDSRLQGKEKSSGQKENFAKFQKWILDNSPRVAKLKEPFTLEEFERLKVDFDLEKIQNLLLAMHNYKPLLTKNESANLTFRAWAKRENHTTNGKNSKHTPPSDEELMHSVAEGISRARTTQEWQ